MYKVWFYNGCSIEPLGLNELLNLDWEYVSRIEKL